jgi:hypothetical protein
VRGNDSCGEQVVMNAARKSELDGRFSPRAVLERALWGVVWESSSLY